MSVSYREATETKEKGADSHREFCGTLGNQGKVSNTDLEPHMLQLLRRSLSTHPCGWPGSALTITLGHSLPVSSSHQPLHTINTLLGPPSLCLASIVVQTHLLFVSQFYPKP